MCIIIYKPKGHKIDEATIREAWTRNPDGAGIMYPDGKATRVFKPYWTVEGLLAGLGDLARWEGTHLVLHFRIATSGQLDLKNTHPHVIDSDTAFVHNGIFGQLGDNSNSDTVQVRNVLKILSRKGIHHYDLAPLLEQVCHSSSSKLVFLRKGKVKIYNERAGTWHEGLWYSNTYSISALTPKYPAYQGYNNLRDQDYTWPAKTVPYTPPTPIGTPKPSLVVVPQGAVDGARMFLSKGSNIVQNRAVPSTLVRPAPQNWSECNRCGLELLSPTELESKLCWYCKQRH